MENNNELNNNMNSGNFGNEYYNSQSKFQVVSDSYSKNNFNNHSNNSSKKSNNSFFKSVFVPFISGIVGCSLVIGTCFGVPEIKEKLVGKSSSVQTSTPSSNNTGTVTQVNLTNYSDTAVYAANKILPSIVGIEIEYTVTSSFYMFGGQSTSTASASGSGIIISEDGYILTNNHVVDSSSSSSSSYSYYELSEATSVKVELYGNDDTYDAKIVGQDSKTDLAVLKIDVEGLTAAEFADSDDVKIGEFVMAVGNPLGLGSSITCGVVSAVNREVTSDNTTYTCIQTDAAINSGNSGGALVNAEGKVIGVNTLKLSGTGVEGIGFAIPINSTLDITDDLIEYNKVLRPYIGLSTIDLNESLAKANNLVVGIYVKSVEDFSAGEKAGIKAGDVIIKADGKEVTTTNELNEIRDTHEIGDEMTITVYRNGNEKELTVTLQEAP